jgi:hypothetical protein
MDRLAPVAGPLLAEVDRALATLGAPPRHPVWSALRRVGVTPADAVATIAGWDPAPLRAGVHTLRQQARAYGSVRIPTGEGWGGTAGEQHSGFATSVSGHLTDGPDSLAGRLTDMARYAEAVAEWYDSGRTMLARALADVLASRAAVELQAARHLPTAAANGPTTATNGPVTAAADIAAYVLDVVADILADGTALADRWAGRLGRLEPRTAVVAPVARSGIDIHD